MACCDKYYIKRYKDHVFITVVIRRELLVENRQWEKYIILNTSKHITLCITGHSVKTRMSWDYGGLTHLSHFAKVKK